MKKMLLLGMLSVFLFSCNKGNKIENVERAFYYWKSDEGRLDEKEQNILDTLKIKKLYVKFFEVKHDQTMGNIPIAKTDFYSDMWYDSNKKKDSLIIVPTVFIKNDVFIISNKNEIDTLASNVHHLIIKFYKEKFANYTTFKEIQIDCDWTLKSKENYFYFLKKLEALSKKELSCTLRLYPYKYRTKMGIPPVKKVTLMCYNLLQPFSDDAKNSILDSNELESYLTVDKKYPIHLDVALPLFSWAHHYQYDEFKGFVNLNKEFINVACVKKSDLWFEVKKDTSVNNNYFRIGDKIKYEDVSQKNIDDAIQKLKKNIKFDETATVTFFHLDTIISNKFNYETLTSFYTSFSN
jgi:hypothetical protein